MIARDDEIEDALDHQSQWDRYLRDDDTIRVGFAIAPIYRRTKDKAGVAKQALKEWSPASCRRDLPN